MSELINEEHAHYYKDVSKLTMLDFYRLVYLFKITDPCVQHALKKLLVLGGRGGNKDARKDAQDVIDTMLRYLQIMDENEAMKMVHAEYKGNTNMDEVFDSGIVFKHNEQLKKERDELLGEQCNNGVQQSAKAKSTEHGAEYRTPIFEAAIANINYAASGMGKTLCDFYRESFSDILSEHAAKNDIGRKRTKENLDVFTWRQLNEETAKKVSSLSVKRNADWDKTMQGLADRGNAVFSNHAMEQVKVTQRKPIKAVTLLQNLKALPSHAYYNNKIDEAIKEITGIDAERVIQVELNKEQLLELRDAQAELKEINVTYDTIMQDVLREKLSVQVALDNEIKKFKTFRAIANDKEGRTEFKLDEELKKNKEWELCCKVLEHKIASKQNNKADIEALNTIDGLAVLCKEGNEQIGKLRSERECFRRQCDEFEKDLRHANIRLADKGVVIKQLKEEASKYQTCIQKLRDDASRITLNNRIASNNKEAKSTRQREELTKLNTALHNRNKRIRELHRRADLPITASLEEFDNELEKRNVILANEVITLKAEALRYETIITQHSIDVNARNASGKRRVPVHSDAEYKRVIKRLENELKQSEQEQATLRTENRVNRETLQSKMALLEITQAEVRRMQREIPN